MVLLADDGGFGSVLHFELIGAVMYFRQQDGFPDFTEPGILLNFVAKY